MGVQIRWALGFGKSSSASSKIMALLHFFSQKSALEMEMASFIALPFAKNMALLPLGEPKKCTRDGYDILHSFALCKKYGTFALGRAKNWYRNNSFLDSSESILRFKLV